MRHQIDNLHPLESGADRNTEDTIDPDCVAQLACILRADGYMVLHASILDQYLRCLEHS